MDRGWGLIRSVKFCYLLACLYALIGLAAGTVKIHVSSIFKALKVSNRTRAVIAARERLSM